jgi:cyclopropane-fatty-acyl-phospholipid synthase
MNLIAAAIGAAERVPLPDSLTLAGIDVLVSRVSRELSLPSPEREAHLAENMARDPIATYADSAKNQQYEVPSEFFGHVLGARRKYSCCRYAEERISLDEAEIAALEETLVHADLRDGQRILELGCGWGSLTLCMAERFPMAWITAVSNSQSQRRYIETQARMRGFSNLSVITADMNVFAPQGRFDRVVSVEMFEHMSNWRLLLQQIKGWLETDGRLFLHVFTHRGQSYRFSQADPTGWIARHFFTAEFMPAHDLPCRFPDLFKVEGQWRWSGANYSDTALDWLANFDAREDEIMPILRATYGDDAGLWKRRWRLFFLATAGLFGHDNGNEWGVGHYRLAPTSR